MALVSYNMTLFWSNSTHVLINNKLSSSSALRDDLQSQTSIVQTIHSQEIFLNQRFCNIIDITPKLLQNYIVVIAFDAIL